MRKTDKSPSYFDLSPEVKDALKSEAKSQRRTAVSLLEQILRKELNVDETERLKRIETQARNVS
jgi:hypothetical protein